MRSWILRPLGAVVIAVALGTAIYTGQQPPTSTPPAAGTANLWVDTNGGTCTRSSSPVAYSDAAACSSPITAADAASAGDTIYVKAGTYGTGAPGNACGDSSGVATYTAWQFTTTTGPESTPGITIAEAPGERVIVNGAIDMSGTDWITLEGFETAVCNDSDLSSAEDNQWTLAVNDNGSGNSANHITIRDLDTSNFYVRGAPNFVLDGGDYGPCWTEPSVTGTALECVTRIEASSVSSDPLVVKNADIHGGRFSNSCFTTPGADCHHECMYVNAQDGVTIKNNKIYDCGGSGAIFTTFSGADADQFNNLLIENNWIGPVWGETSYDCTTSCLSANALVVGHCEVQSGTDHVNTIIRGNSLAGEGLVRGSSACTGDITVTGNILAITASGASCQADYDYFYNAFINDGGTGTCGSNGVNVGATEPYVDATGTTIDFHLSGSAGSWSLEDLVPTGATGGCPATDIDDEARPQDTNCDAGADERNT